MTPRFHLSTPFGNHYTIMSGGEIQRDDGHNTANPKWRMLGLRHVRRNEFIPLDQLAARLPDLQLRFKNGHPQWTVRDFDHGTIREWGNTPFHGVGSIRAAS